MAVRPGNRPKVRHSPMEHPRHQYPQETETLRAIALGCGLTEQIKWGKPCFTLDGRNIALLQRFNEYIAMLFFKGELLSDRERLLAQIGSQTHGPMQLRFRTLEEVLEREPVIKAYLHEAIELERSGVKPARREPAKYTMPAELETRLRTDADLARAFAALTPGRQKGYLFAIGSAAREATRAARVEKFRAQILAGKGLND